MAAESPQERAATREAAGRRLWRYLLAEPSEEQARRAAEAKKSATVEDESTVSAATEADCGDDTANPTQL
jgi:hypothetical protein